MLKPNVFYLEYLPALIIANDGKQRILPKRSTADILGYMVVIQVKLYNQVIQVNTGNTGKLLIQVNTGKLHEVIQV